MINFKTKTEQFDGETFTHKESQIIDGMTLYLYEESGQAALEFSGSNAVEFYWNDETRRAVENNVVITVLELNEVIYRNVIELRHWNGGLPTPKRSEHA